jgi:flagellar biosynthesis protein FlhG
MTQASSATQPQVSPLRAENLIAVASGKGGVGKTWLSITLSQALARTGRKVLLFDGDLGLANVDVQLALMPQKDLGSVITGAMSLEDVVENFPEGGFDIIAGRSGVASLAALPNSRLNELRQDLLGLARRYDSVVLDLGAGIDSTVRHFSGPAGTVLVVTNDEPTSLTDAYAFIKLTLGTNPGADIRIVVNAAKDLKDGEHTFNTIRKACEKFLNYDPPLAGIIRHDSKVKEAIRSQTGLLTRSPNAVAAEDVEKLASGLIRGRGK